MRARPAQRVAGAATWPGDFECTSPTNRMPLRAMVRISCCSSPLSPTALRAALMWVASVESATVRPPQSAARRSLLADDALAILHEIGQQVEHLRLHGNRHIAAAQLARVRIKRMIGKEKLHGSPRTTMSSRSKIKGF